MPKKRKSGGRTGTGGRSNVQCAKCGRMVPRGKAKRISRYVNLVDRTIQKELRAAGAILPSRKVEQWYCISCAIHTHTINIRSSDDRRKHTKL